VSVEQFFFFFFSKPFLLGVSFSLLRAGDFKRQVPFPEFFLEISSGLGLFADKA